MNESPKALSVVTILPPADHKPGQAQPVVGTKVMLSDGSELTGVTSITMTALPGGVWQATITVLPKRIEPITVQALIIEERVPTHCQQLDVAEVTTMGERADGVRRYVRI